MRYDFDMIVLCCGMNFYKWDIFEEENVLFMWVVDMDFCIVFVIIDVL